MIEIKNFFLKKLLTNKTGHAIIRPSNEGGRKTMMTTVKTIDGVLSIKPLSYVLGDDWTYLYSDSWKGVEFDVHACMNGEIVAVVEA